jgi:PAS domain-containing protein
VARLNDMVLIATRDRRSGSEQPIIFANDAFLRRTGYARGDIIGRSMRVLHGPDTDQATVAASSRPWRATSRRARKW